MPDMPILNIEAIPLEPTRMIAWSFGLAVGIAIYLVLALIRRLLIRRLRGEGGARAPGWREGLRDALSGTSRLFLLVLALYAGAFVAQVPAAAQRVIESALVIALFLQGALWASRIAAGWISWYAAQKAAEGAAITNALAVIQLLARVAVWSLALMLILNNLGFDVTALVAGLGIGGVAIALAAQNILGDLFASLAIVLDRPFVVGDFIVFGDYLGTVERIGIKTTRIRSLSGEELVCSNTDLLATRIRNYKRMAERRVVFSIGVTYDTTAEQLARLPALLREIVEAQPEVRFDRAHFQKYGDFALIFEIVYWMLDPDFNRFMDTQQAINLAIYRQAQAEGIAFAFPTQTIHLERSTPAGAS
jgi:MscS family membrane protein